MDSLPNSELLNFGSPSNKSMESVLSSTSGTSASKIKKSDKENFILPRIPSPKRNKKSCTKLKVENNIGNITCLKHYFVKDLLL